MSEPIQFKPPKVQLNIPLLTSVPILVVGMLIAAFVFILGFSAGSSRGQGEIAVLIRKTGENLSPGQVIALEEEQKGIQLEVLAGRPLFP